MVIEVFGSLFCFFLSGSQAPAAGSRGYCLTEVP